MLRSQSTTLFYYISGHGFGHATRSWEVIKRLKALRPDWCIYVRTSASPGIFEEPEAGVYLHYGIYDVGVVQSDGLNLDVSQTVSRNRQFRMSMDGIIAQELEEARKHQVSMIVTDIPSIAMRIAHQLAVPGVTITNFSWDWIYEVWTDQHPEMASIVSQIRQDYSYTDLLLRLPFSADLPAFPYVEDIPMICRKSQITPSEVRCFLGITEDKPIVLLSFGGMGLRTGNLEKLSGLQKYHFLSIGDYSAPGLIIHAEDLIKRGIRYPDVVSAVDVVVTKPGYGIISECIANKTRVLYTDRGPFREYEILVDQMKRWVHVEYIDREQFESGDWEEGLDRLLSKTDSLEQPRLDGADIAASRLIQLMEGEV